jgi:phospholipid/cholesterol/gamma-HCH transport system substrate-binding protein
MRKLVLAAAAGLVAVGGTGIALVDHERPYSVDVVLPAATNLVKGSDVQIKGFSAGKVERLEARDGKAVVTLNMDKDFAPLHDGTTAKISWKATLGERIMDLEPGSRSNAPLPDGALVEGTVDRVEIDQVLGALDAPTRERLRSLVQRLDKTVDGNETKLNATLHSAGPALEALGKVLEGVGDDGPAIRSLVTRLRELTSVFVQRQEDVSGTVEHLSKGVRTVSAEREQLHKALRELPATLDAVNATLARVPGTVAVTMPLLKDLRPATAQLPAVSKELAPVLRDLRPTVAQLRPTLGALQRLLVTTPALLDGAHAVVPGLNTAVAGIQPALAYLRPYTPELAGWLSNWGSAAANYDSNGHYLRAFVQEGGTSVNANPGVLPPGVTQVHSRAPGAAENQPWTDANGSGMR